MSTTTHTPRADVRRPQFNPWLVAVIALVAALVALGAWVVVDQTRSSSTEGLASPKVASMLEDRLAALNSGDAEAISSFYTANAVLEERDVTPVRVTRGRVAIGDTIATYVNSFGLQVERVSPIIQTGRSVAEATVFPGDPTLGWTLVYLLDRDSGKITHQWVLPAQDIG
jgi:hypothetical protein